MLFAALVMTPLGLELAATPDRSGRQSRMYRAATRLQPIAAVVLVVSFALPVGMAALAALGWALVTVLIGLFGVVRFLPRGPAVGGDVPRPRSPAVAGWRSVACRGAGGVQSRRVQR